MRLEEAMAYYGSKYRIAQVLGITRQALTAWGENVPPERAKVLAKDMQKGNV